MIEVVPLAEVTDVCGLVDNLADFFKWPSNHDIQKEFPVFVETYTSPGAVEAARFSQQRCIPGLREQFIAYADGVAVGLGHLALQDNVPETVQTTVPNVSVFVCNPYRDQRIGRRLMEPITQGINERFGGRAWTTILPDNFASQRMVSRAGFRPRCEVDFDGQMHLLYMYAADKDETS